MATIGERVQKGAAWMMLFKLVERSLGLVSTIVLARLLLPADFGLVAMATAVIALLELLSAFNFDMALIQNQSADRSHYDTAWTLNALFGLAVTVALLLMALPLSAFFGDPRLVALLLVLAPGPLIRGLENVGTVAFRKELNFDQEFKFLILKRLATFTITIGLAFYLRSYWALAGGIIIGQVYGVALSYLVHAYRPRLSLAARHELFDFSKWILLNNLISFAYLRAADFVIGRQVGAGALGLYSVANQISNMPTTELIAPINRAIYPGYAKISNDLSALRAGFVKTIAVIAMIALPAAAGIVAVAEIMVNTVLGPTWMDAVPLMQILALSGAIVALETNTFYIHLALGNVRPFTYLMGGTSLTLVVLLVVLSNIMGAVGAAVANLVVALAFFPLYYGAAMRRLELGIGPLVGALWRPLLASTVMWITVSYAMGHVTLGSSLDNIPELLGLVSLGVASYGLAILASWLLAGKPDGAERFALDHIETLAGRLRQRER